MATHTSYLAFLCLCLPVVIAMAGPLDYVLNNPCNCPRQNETNLHLYLHQFPAWPNVANPNEAFIVNGVPSIGFGTTYVHDWFLTAGPNPYETAVARVQGFHLQAGQSSTSWYTSSIFVFQDGSFAGSTLMVLGIIGSPNTAGEWAIMGGTGLFTSAHGTIKYKTFTTTQNGSTDIVRELDIHVLYG